MGGLWGRGAGIDGVKAELRAAVPRQERKAREPSEAEVLRSFDLNSRFGPSKGLDRRARWDRAQKLGLDPPPEVLELLEAGGDNLDTSTWDTLQGKDL